VRETFVIMAGGTGGHVFPGLALADELRSAGYHVAWLGTEAGIESRLVPKAGYDLYFLPVSGVRGKGVLALLKAPLMIAKALFSAFSALRKIQPVAVVGFGGFAAGPGAIAAKLLGKPLLLHEQNSVLGTTNSILQHLADRRLEGFPDTFKKRKGTIFTGNPVRQDIVALLKTSQCNVEPAAGRSSCRILIVGGSRGARALNEQIPALIQRLSSESKVGLEVWHQTGDAERNATQKRYEQLGIEARVDAFIDVMAESYQWADLVVCRAGAMTVAELTLAACASVLVPFPFAIDDHQTKNARWLERNQAALLIPQANLSTEESYLSLLQLVNNSESRKSMAAAAAELSVIDSAQQVYQHCCQLARCEAASV